MMNLARGLLSAKLLLVCSLAAPSAVLAAPDSEALRKQLAEHSPACGSFEQRRWLADFEMDLDSTGSFERQDAMLVWRTQTPVQTEILLGEDNAELPPGYRLQLPVLTGLLAGDWARLGEHFRIDTSGELAAWSAELVPHDSRVAARLPLIQIQGGKQVDEIDLHFADGDRLHLTLSPSSCPPDPAP